jgi:hypothetical protein
MRTQMTDADWLSCSRFSWPHAFGAKTKGHDGRKFLEALRYCSAHDDTWRALPSPYGNRNSVWKRF